MNRYGSAKPLRRGIALCAVVLHMLSTGALPLADAALTGSDHGATYAVDAPDTSSSKSGHDHIRCQFCRSMGTAAILAAVVTGGVSAIVSPACLTPVGDAAPPGADRSIRRSRAPPIA